MTREKVYESLCCYDPRNPDYSAIKQEGDGHCYCDNCFYGRNALAIRILTLMDIIDKE